MASMTSLVKMAACQSWPVVSLWQAAILDRADVQTFSLHYRFFCVSTFKPYVSWQYSFVLRTNSVTLPFQLIYHSIRTHDYKF